VILPLLMFFVAGSGVLLAMTGVVWHTEMRRQKEAELLVVGNAYARSIRSYYQSTGPQQFPASLDQLLLDERRPSCGAICDASIGTRSLVARIGGSSRTPAGHRGGLQLGREKPIKQAGFAKSYAAFANASSYQGWRFLAATELNSVSPAVRRALP